MSLLLETYLKKRDCQKYTAMDADPFPLCLQSFLALSRITPATHTHQLSALHFAPLGVIPAEPRSQQNSITQRATLTSVMLRKKWQEKPSSFLLYVPPPDSRYAELISRVPLIKFQLIRILYLGC